jgi:hypothetical protein
VGGKKNEADSSSCYSYPNKMSSSTIPRPTIVESHGSNHILDLTNDDVSAVEIHG